MIEPKPAELKDYTERQLINKITDIKLRMNSLFYEIDRLEFEKYGHMDELRRRELEAEAAKNANQT